MKKSLQNAIVIVMENMRMRKMKKEKKYIVGFLYGINLKNMYLNVIILMEFIQFF